MLEKGKGAVIGKLHTIQLIEADLQLIMRIFIKNRNNRSIETDFNILKFNFGLRRNYSIENALLEKCLIYNWSMITKQLMIQVITDLAACYDCQLANIESLVLESIGIDRKVLTLIAKILPHFKHYVCTRFGISSSFYSDK